MPSFFGAGAGKQPVIGRLHGAVAGFELSLANACDLAFASEDAYFASAYLQLAVTPNGGGTYWLPRIAGARKAADARARRPHSVHHRGVARHRLAIALRAARDGAIAKYGMSLAGLGLAEEFRVHGAVNALWPRR